MLDQITVMTLINMYEGYVKMRLNGPCSKKKYDSYGSKLFKKLNESTRDKGLIREILWDDHGLMQMYATHEYLKELKDHA